MQFTIINKSFKTCLLTYEVHQEHTGSITVFSLHKIVSLCYFCKRQLVISHSEWNKFFTLKSVKGKWQQDKRQVISRAFLHQPLMPVQNGKSSQTRQEVCHIPCAVLGGKIHSWPWHQNFMAVNLNSCVARVSWLQD